MRTSCYVHDTPSVLNVLGAQQMSAWRLALRRGVLIRLRSPKDLRGVGADGCALPPDHCTGRHEGAGHHFDERGHAPPFPRCASCPTLLSCGPLAPDLMAPGRREAGAKGGGGGCSGYWSRLGLLLHVWGARSAPAGRRWSSLSLSAPALSERVGRSRLEGGGGEGGRGGGACRRLRWPRLEAPIRHAGIRGPLSRMSRPRGGEQQEARAADDNDGTAAGGGADGEAG